MAQLAFLALGGLLVLQALYIWITGMVRSTRFPTLENKRVCLLIAHPDDEAMFFAPTVLALTQPGTGNHVSILCLSTGDADGLGETRKRELKKSGKLLGIGNEDDVVVLDQPNDFPDSMTKTWDEHKIASLLRSRYINEHIDILITFDSQGVSSHPNHISLYHGARAFAASLIHMQGTDKRCPVDVYTLTSVSMLRKYTSLVDVFTTLYMWAKDTRKATMASGEDVQQQHPENLVFMNNLFGSSGPSRGVAWRAMTEAHQSQMRWFRYGWIVLSRYMLMNDLKLETVVVTN